MVIATFIFRPRAENADFHALNDRIRQVAESSEGYLGRKAWRDDTGLEAVVYYWTSRESLEAFRKDATHRVAKSRYKEWYAGYRIEIAEVLEARGDALFKDWLS